MERVEAAPVPRSERIVMWDVLRGVAVLGVLLANMPWMSFAHMVAMDGQDFVGYDPTPLDAAAFWFVRVVADTKFITIFSMLFGAGLGLAAVKTEERGGSSAGFQVRRMAALFVFGMLHGCVVWFGDILGHYALVGCVALPFRRLQAKTLFAIGASFVVLGFGIYFVALPLSMEFTSEAEVVEKTAAAAEVFASGDFTRMLAARTPLYLTGLVVTLPFWGARTLGLFLLGMALVKSGVLRDPTSHRRVYDAMLRYGLLLGIVAQASWVATSGDHTDTRAVLVTTAASYLTALGLSPAYLAIVFRWCESGVLPGLRRRLAAVGQMAFTCYISHSVITGLVFNYGGQYDRWGRFEGLLLTFAIFAFQIWSSPLWLAHFRFGPLEWLWRSFTYARIQPMRRVAA